MSVVPLFAIAFGAQRTSSDSAGKTPAATEIARCFVIETALPYGCHLAPATLRLVCNGQRGEQLPMSVHENLR
jgi:hypothetical protein